MTEAYDSLTGSPPGNPPALPGPLPPLAALAPGGGGDRRREIPWVFPSERLDADAVRIVERLADAGHEAYLVGGCVRDLLFGLRPKDFDIATSAHPNEVRRLFRNCRIIGRRFRLAHVHFRNKIIEGATFRAAAVDASEENGDRLIREDNVFGTAAEDALRRDFTCNALFCDVRGGAILDFVGGVEDIERRVLRTIGDADVRMAEDPIRILRAIRLASRLGCTLDDATWHAIVARRNEILRAAPPRILEDLLRMFRGGAVAPAFDLMRESGVLEVVLPEVAEHLRRALAEGRPEEVDALHAALRETDRLTHAGRVLSSPVQLSVLLAGPILDEIERHRPRERNGPRPDAAAIATETLRGLSQRIALSRKDSDRIRQILLTLDKLIVPKSRRRRHPPGALARRHYTPEAVDLIEIHARATGDATEEVARWRRRLAEVPAAAPEAGARPRPRGRRGGRRR